jgi:hypothetical protein
MKDEFNTAFSQLSNDGRVTVWHVCVYMAIFFRWRQNAYKNPVSVTRREIMRLAHIGSIATYHKCIKQLKEFGYLEYLPSYDPSLGSQIYLLEGQKIKKGSTD